MAHFVLELTENGSGFIFKDGAPYTDALRLEQLHSVVKIYFRLANINLNEMVQAESADVRRGFGLQSFLMSLTGLEAFTNTFFHSRGLQLKREDILKRIEQSHGSLTKKISELIELTLDKPIEGQSQILEQVFQLSQIRNEIVHPRWAPSSFELPGNMPVTIEGLVQNRQAMFENEQFCKEALFWCLLVIARIAEAHGLTDISGFMFHWTGNINLTLPYLLSELGLQSS